MDKGEEGNDEKENSREIGRLLSLLGRPLIVTLLRIARSTSKEGFYLALMILPYYLLLGLKEGYHSVCRRSAKSAIFVPLLIFKALFLLLMTKCLALGVTEKAKSTHFKPRWKGVSN